jgi:DNA-binding transcriptional regulator YiaG
MIKFDLKTLNKLFEEHFIGDEDDISNEEILRRMKAVENHFRIVFTSREIEFDPNNVFATINRIVKRKKIGQGKSLNYHYYIDNDKVGDHNKICGIKNYYEEVKDGEIKVKEKKKYYTPVEQKKKVGRKPKLTETQIKEIKQSGLSQRALAAMYGVAQSLIGRIKKNKD